MKTQVIKALITALLFFLAILTFASCTKEKVDALSDNNKKQVKEEKEEAGNEHIQLAENEFVGYFAWNADECHFIKADGTQCEETFEEVGDFYNGLCSVRKQGKWGFINHEGKFDIKPQYDAVGSFNKNGLTCVKLNDVWTVINRECETVLSIEGSFDRASVDDFGEVYVSKYEGPEKGTLVGLINKNGETVLPCEFEGIYKYNGVIVAYDKSWKGGLFNEEGEAITECVYSMIRQLEGSANFVVEQKGKYGIINEKGDIIVEPIYTSFDNFSNDLYRIVINGKHGFINSDGEIIIEPIYDDIFKSNIDGTQKGEYYRIVLNKDGKFFGGILNSKLEVVLEPIYEAFADEISEDGYFAVLKNGKWGYVNLFDQGKTVTDFIYDRAENFEENGLAVVSMNGKFGAINKKGDFVIECIHDSFCGGKTFSVDRYSWEGGYFVDGYAVVRNGEGLSAVIKENGNPILVTDCEIVTLLKNGLLVFVEKGLDKYGYEERFRGLMNVKGEIILQPIYDIWYEEPGVIWFENRDGWGLMNENGEILSKQFYDCDDGPEVQDNGLVIVGDGERAIINKKGEVLVEPGFYHEIEQFSDNETAKVIKDYKDRKEGVINNKCEVIIEPIYDYISFEYNH